MIASLLLALPLSMQSAQIPAELQSALANAGPNEKIPVIVVMRERPDTGKLYTEMARLPRADRAQAVRDRLRPFAETSQAELDAVVETYRQQGEVERTHRLWMVNALRLKATKRTITAVAALPGVERIKWDPALPASETTDIAPPLGYEIGRGAFGSSFETAEIPPEFEIETTGPGRATVRRDNGPTDGKFHLVLDSAGGLGTSTAELHLNLSHAKTSTVSFDAMTFDGGGPDSGVYLSVNQLDYHKVLELPAGRSYASYEVDLAQELGDLGLPFTPNVSISVQWASNGAAPSSGIALDNVRVTTVYSSLAAEPNISGLQADQLWAIGITGGGAKILNVDSGVANTHPALANSMWANPGEIAGNSIDDDSNGYVDDVWGWDFGGNDASPYDGGHGTNTGGIISGDGTGNGGVCTGMAPGTTQGAAKIAGEGDALAAYQYAVDNGFDVITSSHSYKWPSRPDYTTFRLSAEVELAAGVIHANSIGNQGNSAGGTSYPIPFNISAPGNCPGPWRHPDEFFVGGTGSMMACAGILLGGDALYTSSGQGPSTWENFGFYSSPWPHTQLTRHYDYPYRGGNGPGLLKPDVCTYTNVATTSGGSGYTSSFGGTSAATPHLGGAMTLLVSGNPRALPRQISNALQVTAVDLGPAGKDLRYGAGKIQVYDAHLRLRGLVTAIPQVNNVGDTADLEVTGPAGQPYVFVAGLNLGSTPTGLGFDLEITDFVYLVGAHTGYSTPTIEPVSVPNDPIFSGFTLYMQIVTDDTTGATGQWLSSLTEAVAWF